MPLDAATYVVLGTGPLGRAIGRELLEAGERVRFVNRSGSVDGFDAAEVVGADVSSPEEARRVCEGANVVFHCMAPAYTDWPTTLVPLMHGAIEGARAAKAKLVYGDNLYMYGPVSGPLTEDLPYAATTRKGRVRAQAAELLLRAHVEGKVQAAIGRSADFYGPGATLSRAGEMVFDRLLEGKPARVLGDPDKPHTYTFIRDFARALITLGEREEALGEAWHVPSAETLTTRQFVEVVAEEAGVPAKITAAPSWAIRAMGIFNPTMREVAEMLYETEEAFVMDHSKYARTFGNHATPHREAIRETVKWYRERKTQ